MTRFWTPKFRPQLAENEDKSLKYEFQMLFWHVIIRYYDVSRRFENILKKNRRNFFKGTMR